MKNIEFVVFDKKVIDSLLHNIDHFTRCLAHMPEEIKSLRWDCKVFRKEMSLKTYVDYIGEKLERISKTIELAQESPEQKKEN